MDIKELDRDFKHHVATFHDYGKLKMIDFKNPDNSEYRIRFIFEEDYCRLHISGDLGELIASNYNNMTFEHFDDFVNNAGYFSEKVDCSSRPLYFFDQGEAVKDIDNCLIDIGEDPMKFQEEISDAMLYFSRDYGIGAAGANQLENSTEISVYDSLDFGKRQTGILNVYLYAFKLAVKQLKERGAL